MDTLRVVVSNMVPRGLFSDLEGVSTFLIVGFVGVTGAAVALFRTDARVVRCAISFFSCRFPTADDFKSVCSQ